jgi:hypothetical protein
MGEVCEFLNWKNPRRVMRNLKEFFQADEKSLADAEEEFRQFWKRSERTDENGNPYIALHPSLLSLVKRFSAERFSRRTQKGVATKRKRASKGDPNPPAGGKTTNGGQLKKSGKS